MKKLLLFLLTVAFVSIFASGQDVSTNPDFLEAEKLDAQAGKFYAAGQYDKALETALKELKLRQKLGDKHYIAIVNFNIGGIYREKGDLAQSVKYFETAVLNYVNALGENHVKVYTALKELAHVFILKKEMTEAAKRLVRAQLIAEKLYGSESQPTSEIYLTHAQIFWGIKNTTEADNAYQRAILINDKLLSFFTDDNRPDVDEYMCFLSLNDPRGFQKNWKQFSLKRKEVRPNEETDDDDIVVKTKLVKFVEPELPPGTSVPTKDLIVVLRITIDENGDVTKVKSMCSVPEVFVKASRDAAYKFKFKPRLENGVPVKISRIFVFNY